MLRGKAHSAQARPRLAPTRRSERRALAFRQRRAAFDRDFAADLLRFAVAGFEP